MPSKASITIGLSETEKQALRNAAMAASMTVSEYVKRLLGEHVPDFKYESKPENRGGDRRSWEYQGVYEWGYVDNENEAG